MCMTVCFYVGTGGILHVVCTCAQSVVIGCKYVNEYMSVLLHWVYMCVHECGNYGMSLCVCVYARV